MRYKKISDLKEDNYDNILVNVKIKIDNRQINLFKEYIKHNRYITSIYSITGEYDFVFEAIFRKYNQLNNFIDEIESKFSVIKRTQRITTQDLRNKHNKSEFTIKYVNN